MQVETERQGTEPRSPFLPAQLVKDYFMDVYSLCFRHLGHPHDAEDATQETFLALFRDPEKLGGAESPRAWVLAVARNTAISLLRLRRRAAPLDGAPAPAAPIEEPVDRERLHESLASLSEDERHLLEMRFLEGKNGTEMAAATGRNQGAIATALCRALGRLRSVYHQGADR
jgi:RNA polymerase sigma-70 factor (ECF subfamily)